MDRGTVFYKFESLQRCMKLEKKTNIVQILINSYGR